jgi:uncharacterized damage-inducible protein DinB
MRSHPPARGRLAEALAAFTKDTAGRGNWGHPGLAKILKGVEVEEARWKPATDAHSIWEEVNHIIYWSEDVLDRLEGRGALRKQAWPAGEGGPEDWRRAVRRAARLHAALVRRVAATSPAAMSRKAMRSRRTTAPLILGCASHIAYHTGRIALLRRLHRDAHQPAAPAV